MLLKCYTQYVIKYGKLSSGHRTEKGQFSFQSQRKAMLKNVQTTLQLCSFHMLARLACEILQASFQQYVSWELPDVQDGFTKKGRGTRVQNTKINWTMEKAGGFQQKSTFASLTMLKLLIVQITTNWKILKEMGVPDHLTCFLRNLYMGQKKQKGHGTTDQFKLGKEAWRGCILSPCLTYM